MANQLYSVVERDDSNVQARTTSDHKIMVWSNLGVITIRCTSLFVMAVWLALCVVMW